VAKVTVASARRGGLRAWDAITRRPNIALGVVLAAFVAIHLARLSRVPINGNGDNYLLNATVFADGHLAHSQYSPGWGFVLTPVAAIAGSDFRLMHLLASLLTLALAVVALVLVHRFLARHVGDRSALVLVAILALGQTATNILVGAEVEPASLLLVTATLLALDHDRPWLAVVTTALAAQLRIAVIPFLGVLWLLRARRERGPALAALGSVALGVVSLAVTRGSTGYVDISSQVYETDRGLAGIVSGMQQVVPRHVAAYARFGLPSMVWPGRILDNPVGAVLGLVTFVCIVVGAWELVTARGGLRAGATRLPSNALIAGVATFGAYAFWPANDPTKLRLTMQFAPLVLLAAFAGTKAILRRLGSLTWMAGPLAAAALGVGLIATTGLVVTQRTSERGVDDFLEAAERARDELPRGPVLTRLPNMMSIVSGRMSQKYDATLSPAAVLAAADRSGSCAVVVDGISGLGGGDARLRAWFIDRQAVPVVSAGHTLIFVIDDARCR
jgi:hypothetical protein